MQVWWFAGFYKKGAQQVVSKPLFDSSGERGAEQKCGSTPSCAIA